MMQEIKQNLLAFAGIVLVMLLCGGMLAGMGLILMGNWWGILVSLAAAGMYLVLHPVITHKLLRITGETP